MGNVLAQTDPVNYATTNGDNPNSYCNYNATALAAESGALT